MVGETRTETQLKFCKTLSVSVLLVLYGSEEETHNSDSVTEITFWDVQEWIALQMMKYEEN
jgi:hypothetical protein